MSLEKLQSIALRRRRALHRQLDASTAAAVRRDDAQESGAARLQPGKLRNFKRAERRLFLALVDRLVAPDEDMWRYREMWLRLGERLHPGEHADKAPKAAAAFGRLRASERPSTGAARFEIAQW